MSQQINLYDPALRRQRDPLSLTNVALGAVALLFCVVAVGAALRVSAARIEAEARTLEPQSKALQEQIATLGKLAGTTKPDPRLEQAYAEAKAQLDARTEMLALLQKGLGPQATGFSEYLRGFARQTPQGLWLVGFSVDGDGSAMKIRGRTIDPALIPEYIHRLNSEKAFEGRAFSSLELGIPDPAPGTRADAKPAVAPYHEFTLAPAAEQDSANSQSPFDQAKQILPVDAAKAMSDAGKVLGGGSQ